MAIGNETDGPTQPGWRRSTPPTLFQAAGMEASRTPTIGRIVGGRYRLLANLASGGMGVVYLAERIGLGRHVAIKFPHAPVADHPRYLSAFEREAEAMSRLSHPHCVPVIDFGVDGAPYLVMEFVTGVPLSKRLSQGPLPWERAVRIQMQLLAGLAHANGRQIVHRDIKPANIMLTEATGVGDHVRVLDFGLARLREGAETVDPSVPGSIVGTPHYMSPEQWQALPLDGRTDVYAAGVVLCEMLTGRTPFAAGSLTDLRNAHLLTPPPPLAQLNADVVIPPGLEALVLRALAKNPDDRFPSAQVFYEALSQQLVACAPTLPLSSVTAVFRPALSTGQIAVRQRGWTSWVRGLAAHREPLLIGALSCFIIVTAYLASSSERAPKEVVTRSPRTQHKVANVRDTAAPDADMGLVPGQRLPTAAIAQPQTKAVTPSAEGSLAMPPHSGLSSAAPGGERSSRLDAMSRPERIARLREAMSSGRHEEALLYLRRMRTEEPSNAKWAYLIGKTYFEKHWRTDAFIRYRDAMRLDERYRKQTDIIENLAQGLGDESTRRLATEVLAEDAGIHALPLLRRVSQSDARPQVRSRALALYERLRARAKHKRSADP